MNSDLEDALRATFRQAAEAAPAAPRPGTAAAVARRSRRRTRRIRIACTAAGLVVAVGVAVPLVFLGNDGGPADASPPASGPAARSMFGATVPAAPTKYVLASVGGVDLTWLAPAFRPDTVIRGYMGGAPAWTLLLTNELRPTSQISVTVVRGTMPDARFQQIGLGDGWRYDRGNDLIRGHVAVGGVRKDAGDPQLVLSWEELPGVWLWLEASGTGAQPDDLLQTAAGLRVSAVAPS